MAEPATDAAFSGSIPLLYDSCLGPLLFEPYARDLAERIAALGPTRILETAAGTGIVTEALAHKLPETEIVATDLNQAMLDVAARRVRTGRVTFQQADAQSLLFPASSFEIVACQFGVMFFPDRRAAYTEALRVLKPGGHFIFNVWDRIENNPVTAIVSAAVAGCFPDDPPDFFARTPFGYHRKDAIQRDLEAAGFREVIAETVELRSCRPVREVAIGLCQGTPLRLEIESRDPSRLGEVADAAAAALSKTTGSDEIDGPMSAHVFVARV